MDLTIRKSDFLRELQYVQGVVEKKSTMPILSNLLLETSGNALVITATDLDVTLRCSCKAEVRVAGAFTVSARKIFDIVRLLPDADITMKALGHEWMNIACLRSKFKVAGLSKDNFPEIPSVKGKSMELPGGIIRQMIPRCIFAITQEESRYTLSGALLLVKPGSITLVTTDGHRLALLNHHCDIPGLEGESRVLIPKKTLVELGKLAAEGQGPITFGHSDNHLFFRVGERFLVSRILSGQFPNFDLVIPRENNILVQLPTIELADALRRANVMADEQSHAVRLSLSEGRLDISAASADFGEASEALSITFAEDPLHIGFNAQYLLDFLGSLESETVELHLRDKETQGLLKPGVAGDYEYTYVIMPLKV